MSFLNLRSLPAKKAWKKFTSKLQSKLHKLHKSRAIKKVNKRSNLYTCTSAKSIFFQGRDPKKKRAFHISDTHSRFQLQKSSEPVFVDQLFAHASPKQVKLVDQRSSKMIGKKEEDGKKIEVACISGDDMWESLGFTSPQMRGIDERAEQFISSFRAEMEFQGRIARDL